MELDPVACHRALRSRDARFDGRFFTGVRSTGIYCRPICPARTPKPEHCEFFPSAAAAQSAGFRPCLRCRPEVAPHLAAAHGTSGTVIRALRLIDEGALDEAGAPALAERLGVGERHLRRLFDRHLGASPLAVAQTRRLLFAKRLIDETSLPMAEVALAAGFGSVRRFNHAVRTTWGRAPRALRRERAAHTAPPASAGLTLRLPFRPPDPWPAVAGFLAPRAIPGVDAWTDGAWSRGVDAEGGHGWLEVRRAPGGRHLRVTLRLPRLAALAGVVARVRRVFDLDADPEAIAAHLARDPRLAPRLARLPGLRVPGAFDPFELAVRAILGQQVSVAAATTLAGRLVRAFGEPLKLDPALGETPAERFLFPRPEALAGAALGGLGLPRARAAAIAGFAAAVAERPEILSARRGLEEATDTLQRLPGVGAWTAAYVAMRALREPDAFPSGDLALLRASAIRGRRPTPAQLLAAAERWRPWRAYAAMAIWMSEAAAPPRGEA